MVGTIQDVTERHESEQRVRFQAQLLDQVNAAVVATGAEGQMLYWNAAAEELLGWTADEVLGVAAPELIGGADWEDRFSKVGQVVDHGEPWEGELELRHKDGSDVPVLSRTAPLRDPGGNVTGYVGACVDLTARREAEQALRDSEERKAAIISCALDSVVTVEEDGRISEFNRAAERTFGFSHSQAIGSDCADLIVPARHRGRYRAGLSRLTDGESSTALATRVEAVALCADRREIPVELSITRTRKEPPAYTGFVRDISDQKAAEEAERIQYAIARVLADAPTVEAAMPRLLSALGEGMGWSLGAFWLQADEVLTCASLWHAEGVATPELDRVTLDLELSAGAGLPGAAIEAGRPIVVNPLSPYADGSRAAAAGEVNLCWALALPITSGDTVLGALDFLSHASRRLGERTFAMLATVGAQIGQYLTRRQAEQRLSEHLVRDPLTALPNRTLLLDRLRHAVTRAHETHGRVAVMVLDLDGFKRVNESFGTETGDCVLSAVAPRLTGCMRNTDTVARFGGDEFVVLLEDANEGELLRLAGQALTHLKAPISAGGETLTVTASIGIALADNNSPEEVLRNADVAMRRARHLGGGRIELFDEALGRGASARLETERALREALGDDELKLHYQPIIELGTGGLRRVEALVRWHHPERGLVPPGEFIPIAEESGLILRLGTWVLREACKQAATWRREFGSAAPLPVNVNVAPMQLVQPGFPALVGEILGETGATPADLALEITETALMVSPDAAADAVRTLRAQNVHVVLDDFGTGYSSLSHLQQFPVDAIKIDRSFVAGMDGEGDDAALVRAVIDLGHALGKDVVAEGVETEAQAYRLHELGCEMAQGYLFSRPVSAAELIANLDKRAPAFARRVAEVPVNGLARSPLLPAFDDGELFALDVETLIEELLVAVREGNRRTAAGALGRARAGGLPVGVTLARVVAPVMYRIGSLWESGQLSVADEHLATQTCMQALPTLSVDAEEQHRGTALLATLQGERHGFALNAIALVFEAEGFAVQLVGSDVPLAALCEAVEASRPTVVGLSQTMPDDGSLREVINHLAALEFAPHILLGGAGVPSALRSYGGATFVANAEEVSAAIERDRLPVAA